MLSISAGRVNESVLVFTFISGTFILGSDTLAASLAAASRGFSRRSPPGVHAIIRMKAQSITIMADFCFTGAKVRKKSDYSNKSTHF